MTDVSVALRGAHGRYVVTRRGSIGKSSDCDDDVSWQSQLVVGGMGEAHGSGFLSRQGSGNFSRVILLYYYDIFYSNL